MYRGFTLTSVLWDSKAVRQGSWISAFFAKSDSQNTEQEYYGRVLFYFRIWIGTRTIDMCRVRFFLQDTRQNGFNAEGIVMLHATYNQTEEWLLVSQIQRQIAIAKHVHKQLKYLIVIPM